MAHGSVEQLLGYAQADRTIRAYAYLTASLNVQNDVSDVQDCLLPFLASVVGRTGGAPLNLADLKRGLEEYGLKVPVYAIEQLLTRLAKRGIIEWSPIARAYLPTGKSLEGGDEAPLPLTDAFDVLEEALGHFGTKLGVAAPPVSETWNDALIHFLRSDRPDEAMRAKKIKDVIVGDGREVETFIVARFVQECQVNDKEIFDHVTQVFTVY